MKERKEITKDMSFGKMDNHMNIHVHGRHADFRVEWCETEGKMKFWNSGDLVYETECPKVEE